MGFVGIDSVLLTQQFARRLRQPILRKGLLGVGVETSDLEQFNETYSKSLSELFKQNGQEIKRPVYCAREIASILGFETLEEELSVLSNFKDSLLPAIDNVHLFYTFIFGLKEGLVSIYGHSPNYVRIPLTSQDKSIQDFYDLISNTYPMLCAWELRNYKNTSTLFLDNFQGRVCPAWLELGNAQDILVYYKGDQCNKLISAADILLRIIKIKMIPNKACFLKSEIEKIAGVVGNKTQVYFIGKQCLNKITPHVPSRMKPHRLVKHPIAYLAKENPKDEGEESIIENSPLFNDIVKRINSGDGCAKYFHPDDDSREIKQGDQLVSFGKRGDQIIEKLKRLKYPIDKFS